MQLRSMMFWLAITVAQAVDGNCAKHDGTTKAVDVDGGDCKCGLQDNNALTCTAGDQNCYNTNNAIGEDTGAACLIDCATDSGDAANTKTADGATAVDAAKGCRCGNGATDGKYAFVADDKFCLVVAGQGYQLPAAIAACPSPNGLTKLASATVACTCGSAKCLADEYCDKDANLCTKSPPYAACPATQDHTTRCACGTEEICDAGQSCDASADSGKGGCTDIAQCATTDGSDPGADCASKMCGDLWFDATAGVTCFKDADGKGHKDVTACEVGNPKKNSCKCTTKWCGATEYCAANDDCQTVPADDCATNGSVAAGANKCKCDTKVCASGEFCDIAYKATADADAAVHCHAADADTKPAVCVDKATQDTACACGTKKTCAAKNGDVVDYCLKDGAAGEGECISDVCGTKDGETVSDKACFCGDRKCAATTEYCLEIAGADANAAKTYACAQKAVGDAMKATRTAAATACDTAKTEAAATCETEKTAAAAAAKKKAEDACAAGGDDDAAGSASCIGSFVTTMATALNNM